MNINELIDGYLNITGRPAATLTVNEYLSFFDRINKTPEISTGVPHLLSESVKEESVAKTPKEPSNAPEKTTKPVTAVPVQKKPDPPAKKPVNALQMLQSISG